MKTIKMANGMSVSAVSLGCMRFEDIDYKRTEAIMDKALELGINYYDHADVYGAGRCESLFGEYLKNHKSVRDGIYIQTKCALKVGEYDFSKEHIISAVEGSLSRLGVDYVDALLLHRPDTLMEPEEVAAAFSKLESEGKVKHFGVSNHNPMQIELLKTAVKQPLNINQLQFSVTEAGMITSGMNTNMKNTESVMHDGSVLEYSRINNITIQAWSPFQYGLFKGAYVDSDKYPVLNAKLGEIADKYGITKTGVVTAWILRHPANMQMIAGTVNPKHLQELCSGADITLARTEWYEIYRSAGHYLP